MKGKTASQYRPSILESRQHEDLRRRIEKVVPDLPLDISDPAVWSARFVIAADGAEQRGLGFPWYMHRQKMIHDWHGGRIEVVSIIADFAVALLNNDPDMSVDKATLEAGNEFRRMIRGQWDRNCGGPNEFDLHIEYVADRIREADRKLHSGDKTAEALGYLGLAEEHPANIENPERERVRLLREAQEEVLTPLQQEVIGLRSGGMTYQAIADELDLTSRTQAYAACKRGYARLKEYITEREAA